MKSKAPGQSLEAHHNNLNYTDTYVYLFAQTEQPERYEKTMRVTVYAIRD